MLIENCRLRDGFFIVGFPFLSTDTIEFYHHYLFRSLHSAVSMTLLLAAKHYCYFHLDIGGRSRSAKCRGQCLEERRGEESLLFSRRWSLEDGGSFLVWRTMLEVFRRGWEAKSNFWCIIINERKSALLNVLIHGSGSAYRFTRFANSGVGKLLFALLTWTTSNIRQLPRRESSVYT